MPIKKLFRKISLFLRKMKNRRQWGITLLLFIGVSFILFHAGHFLSGSSNRTPQGGTDRNTSTAGTRSGSAGVSQKNSIQYTHKSKIINGLKQEIHILTVNPGIPGVRIQPVLSHDLIYGFEKLSEMAGRKRAAAAVNGGFFSMYGLPAGMVMINGELLSASTGRYPVFVMQDGKASFQEFKSSLEIEYAEGGIGADNASSKSGGLKADCLNLPATRGTAVYTPVYGQYTRADRKNLSITVVNGVVSSIALYKGEVEIPRNGLVISFFDTQKYKLDSLPLKKGDSVRLIHRPDMGGSADAYECGCRLVRDGEPAVPEKDAWIGVLTNHDPRTAIGIREDGAVILLAVDGRQPGYSVGFTGRELAAYLIGLGVKDAAMLDGGASTEMLVSGKLAGRPSFKGEERPLGGGLLVLSQK